MTQTTPTKSYTVKIKEKYICLLWLKFPLSFENIFTFKVSETSSLGAMFFWLQLKSLHHKKSKCSAVAHYKSNGHIVAIVYMIQVMLTGESVGTQYKMMAGMCVRVVAQTTSSLSFVQTNLVFQLRIERPICICVWERAREREIEREREREREVVVHKRVYIY